MKYLKIGCLSALLIILMQGSLRAQGLPAQLPRRIGPQQPVSETTLTKFDLNFPGGTPSELVAAIQKAMGKPLNAIVPDEPGVADVHLPALKMNNVDVQQLFSALEGASERQLGLMQNQGLPGNFNQASSRYGFRMGPGPTSDDTIWYFYVSKPIREEPFKTCRFYPLTPYLDRGISVDDITTAIKTGSKMLGDEEGLSMSFHKDTKLLIATGEPAKLLIIDSVLKALDSTKTVAATSFQDRLNEIQKASAEPGPAEKPKPAEKKKDKE